MASLPSKMVWKLVHACIDAGLDRASILISVPRAVAADIPLGNTLRTQLFSMWSALNELSWPDAPSHPMMCALEAAANLSEILPQAHLFQAAQEHFALPTTSDDAKDLAFLIHFTRRTKERYLSYGCRVTPGLDHEPGPFIVEDPDKRISIVAVFHRSDEAGRPLERTIAAVERWLEEARGGGEDAEGYVVLAPHAHPDDRATVRGAKLHPVDYKAGVSLTLDDIARVVRGALDAEADALEPSFSIITHGSETRPLDAAWTSFSRDFGARVRFIVHPRETDTTTFVRSLFCTAARRFLQHGPPAPLPLGADWRARRTTDCACDVFNRYGIPAAPITLEPMLKEGAVCPLFVLDSAEPAPTLKDPSLTARLVQSLSTCPKALVVVSPEHLTIARQFEHSLRDARVETRIVRALLDAA